MRLLLATFAAFAILLGDGQAAQRPDFSGQWFLMVAPETARTGVQLMADTTADNLTIRQTATSITVEHPSKLGTHPRAATHGFGSHGIVGGAGELFRSDVFWFGDQLVIEATSSDAPDAEGQTRTIESSEIWSLDFNGRLVIDCAERQSRAAAARTILVYNKR